MYSVKEFLKEFPYCRVLFSIVMLAAMVCSKWDVAFGFGLLLMLSQIAAAIRED